MSEPIRILHVLGGLSLGGAESRIMDLYRSIDKEKIQFDFLIHTDKEQYFEKEIEELGGKVYRVPRFKVYNWFSYKRDLKQFFSHHKEFAVVHGHMTSTASIYLDYAKKEGHAVTISHARSAGVEGGFKGIVVRLLRKRLVEKSDYCLSCSGKAAEAVFGAENFKQGKVRVIPNAIQGDKYRYNELKRQDCRDELGLFDKFVVGHVGSFRPAKNHEFLIKIFKEIHKIHNNAVLLLVGGGELMEQIKEQVKETGLSDCVIFAGVKSDVSPYYQAMDCLVFPSLFEGLPGTVIEAQVSGLPCAISDTITEEVVLTDLVKTFSLSDAPEVWAKWVVEQEGRERKDRLKEVQAAGFDMRSQVAEYEKLYLKGQDK